MFTFPLFEKIAKWLVDYAKPINAYYYWAWIIVTSVIAVIGLENWDANGLNYETKLILAIAIFVWLVGWVVAVFHFKDKVK